MMLNPFLLLSLLIWLSGDAAAQYQRTPAGENIDVRVLSRTPDDLKGKAIIDSSGQVVGRFDGVVMAGPATFAVVTPLRPGQSSGDRSVVVRLSEFKIDRQDRITSSRSADDIASSPEYAGQTGYQRQTDPSRRRAGRWEAQEEPAWEFQAGKV
jgi:hypothetical protein